MICATTRLSITATASTYHEMKKKRLDSEVSVTTAFIVTYLWYSQ